MAGLGILGLAFAGCGEEAKPAASAPVAAVEGAAASAESAAGNGSRKILVAYFSRKGDNYEVGYIEKGNTHILADIIAQELGGADTFEIKTVKEYPADYRECTEDAKQEKAQDARPKLAATVSDFVQYDTIFLGYPIWWSDLPMPVYTFLESYNWQGKTVIPFCTSAGDNMTGLEDRVIPRYAQGATLQDEGLGLRGKSVQDNPEEARTKVRAWLKKLGYQQ
ncbi:MAG: NAD(P)H-dependent oxidoreductase [Selenomonas sp.]|nr:NAD(P)H-dependent oxidoreductase [Selenomonas sp.]